MAFSVVLPTFEFSKSFESFKVEHAKYTTEFPSQNKSWFPKVKSLPFKLKSSRKLHRQQAVASEFSSYDVNQSDGASSANAVEDAFYMRRAVELSQNARGKTSPNPMVGCVIVKNGAVIGEGFHPKAGEPHAEVFALREAGEAAEGATAYVSLEPCNHFGRTPPCSQALVTAKVKRVVVGTTDPNPLVGGNGIKTLVNAGIEVTVGVEQELCRKNVEGFFCRISKKRPFVTMRYSMSLDGKVIETAGLDENEEGKSYSKLLELYDAVVVVSEALDDDPMLLSLEKGAKQPLRVILAHSLNLNRASTVFDSLYGPTLVICSESGLVEDTEKCISEKIESTQDWLTGRGVDVVAVTEIGLDAVLDLCYQRDASLVLFDCHGPRSSGEDFARQVLEEGIADKVNVVVVPSISGGDYLCIGFDVVQSPVKLRTVSSFMSGENVVIEGYVIKSD